MNQGRIRASYSNAHVGHAGNPAELRLGGLVAYGDDGEIIASYAAGPLTPGSGGGSDAAAGGLVGVSSGSSDTITNSYCDTTVTQSCVGDTINGSSATATGHPTADLQQPNDYTGIYANWNLDLPGIAMDYDSLWDFGGVEIMPDILETEISRWTTIACGISAPAANTRRYRTSAARRPMPRPPAAPARRSRRRKRPTTRRPTTWKATKTPLRNGGILPGPKQRRRPTRKLDQHL